MTDDAIQKPTVDELIEEMKEMSRVARESTEELEKSIEKSEAASDAYDKALAEFPDKTNEEITAFEQDLDEQMNKAIIDLGPLTESVDED